MLRDLPHLAFFVVRDDDEVERFLAAAPGLALTKVGFERLGLSGEGFAADFYRQLGLDYRLRWEGFRVVRDPAREQALYDRLVGPVSRYLFLHDDPRRGLTVDQASVPRDMPAIRPVPGLTDVIFDYGLVLERAAAIHCIDSSFRHLVDSMAVSARDMVLHFYVRHTDAPSRHPWRRLDREPAALGD
jgi:hypothetical protein